MVGVSGLQSGLHGGGLRVVGLHAINKEESAGTMRARGRAKEVGEVEKGERERQGGDGEKICAGDPEGGDGGVEGGRAGVILGSIGEV